MRWTIVFAGIPALALSTGCNGEAAADTKQVVQQGGAAVEELPQVLAEIGGKPVTLADVRSRSGDALGTLDAQYQRARYTLVNAILDTILRERTIGAEAERRGKSADELVVAEAGGNMEPTEVEISAWYDQNSSRLSGRTLSEVRSQIADYLRTQRRRDAEEKLLTRLRAEQRVVVHLQPYRARLDNTGAPSTHASAPVTIVEFSDFQCPFCKSFVPTLKQVEKAYGDRVRIVYRQFPLTSIHPFAWKAAEASLCANEQGKFWALHDVMFQEQDRLGVSELKAKAARLGMDQKRFASCLDSGKYAEQVQADLSEGQRAGVTGTPALFLNGVFVEGGAMPFESLKKAIDAELARQGK